MSRGSLKKKDRYDFRHRLSSFVKNKNKKDRYDFRHRLASFVKKLKNSCLVLIVKFVVTCVIRE